MPNQKSPVARRNRGIRLQPRDIQFLELLNKHDVASYAQARAIYSQGEQLLVQAHTNRLCKLYNEGYIKKPYKEYITLGERGTGLFANDEQAAPWRPKSRDHARRRSLIMDMELRIKALNNPCLELLSRREVSRKEHFKFTMYMNGYLRCRDAVYLVYFTGPEPVWLNMLRKEMIGFAQTSRYNRAIVFPHNFEDHNAIRRELSETGNMDEILLLPYPQGLTMLSNYHSDFFQEILHEQTLGAQLSGYHDADFESPDAFIADFLLNNVVRRHMMSLYQGKTHKSYKIICLESQYKSYALQDYPGSNFVIIPDDYLFSAISHENSNSACLRDLDPSQAAFFQTPVTDMFY